MTLNDLDTMVRHYIIAGLWATTDNADESGGEPLDANYDADDLAPESVASITVDCRDFIASNADDLAGMDAEQAGHDFLLTRDGHGAGFWDRGLGDRGDRLSANARPYGDSGFYVGDDGRIHV
jgi:hypothetical protein